ncbi:MAG: hypothetical protein GTO41_26575 [Burkholderiales bacterium]|nr:hypothetical protein [Burkholderiales bacterium]
MSSDVQTAAGTDPRLKVNDFPSFYNWLIGLRFPIDVAQVLELRFLLNHAADTSRPAYVSADDRQFRDALQAAIESFGIHNKLHRERLIKILTVIRDLHTAHLMESRAAELKLRNMLADIRKAHSQMIRHGLFSLIATIFAVLVWLGSSDPGWTIKVLTLGLAYITWDCFHSLPTLDREPEFLTPALNEVLRRRVDSPNWKRLIHKLSLLLGYKRIPGLEVFPVNSHA